MYGQGLDSHTDTHQQSEEQTGRHNSIETYTVVEEFIAHRFLGYRNTTTA